MTEPSLPAPQAKAPTHWPSVLVLINSALVILVLLLGIGLFFLSGSLAVFGPDSAAGEAAMLFSYALAGVVVSALLLPSIVLAIRRLAGKPAVPGRLLQRLTRIGRPTMIIAVYLLLLGGGYFLNTLTELDWLVMPAINVLILSLPVAGLLWLGTRRLLPSSPQRNWSTFALGMTVSPAVIITAELIAILLGVVVLSVLIVTAFPDAIARIQEFSALLQEAAYTQQVPEQELLAFLKQPWVVVALLGFTAVLVPLVEEAIKPVGVWLLAGRKLSLQDGWVLGLLSGAGFALVENLGNLAVGQGWAFLMLARAGAASLHMFNSGIIGYTFALSRQKKRWRDVLLAYLAAVVLHAAWNGTAVLASLQSIDAGYQDNWAMGFVLVLGGLTAAMVAAINLIHNRLSQPAEAENLKSEIEHNDRPDPAVS
jgi:RsiW-degrading membrane proteinase PrsW (M82 family)